MRSIIRYTIAMLLLAGTTQAQNSVNSIQLPELRRDIQRTIIRVPNLDGYQTLKCDLHMHTIFSDGVVWPTIRVREAWEEGLDAIAITDHIENYPSKKDVGGDDNSSYEIARDAAGYYNILLIKGGEITREMPPGHLNALFIKDANKLDVPDARDAIMEAHNQGGFLIWNHPGWKAQQPDTCRRFEIHDELIDKKIINGIEVFNEKEWYPIALKWCIEDRLAVLGHSDIHDVNAHYYPLDKYHRPMNLIFAKERSIKSIKEALFANRSVAWFSKYVVGPESLLSKLYQKSVSIKELPSSNREGNIKIEITNNSDFQFDFDSETTDFPKFSVKPNSVAMLRLPGSLTNNRQIKYKISNWFVDMHKNLDVVIEL